MPILLMFTCYFRDSFFRKPDVLFSALYIGIKKIFFPLFVMMPLLPQSIVESKTVLRAFMNLKAFKTIPVVD